MKFLTASKLPNAVIATLIAFIAPGFAQAEDLLWLESPHDQKALQWARNETERTKRDLGSLPSAMSVRQELEQVLKESPAEAEQYIVGNRRLRFFRDAASPYGELQVAEGTSGAPKWASVLNMAALRKKEGVPYELQAYGLATSCLAPEYDRCLLRLSPSGGDEVEVREFSLSSGKFVENGFSAPKGRVFAEWMSRDQVLVVHPFAGATKTSAGWGGSAFLWKRGQKLSDARHVYSGQATDSIMTIGTVGAGRDVQGLISRVVDYSTFETFVVDQEGNVRQIPVPKQLKAFGIAGQSSRHVLFQLAADSVVEGVPYAAETLLAYDAAPSAKDGSRITKVYVPSTGEYVDARDGTGSAGGKDEFFFVVSSGLRKKIMAARLDQGKWKARDVFQAEPGETLDVRAVDRTGNQFVATRTGFLTPKAQILVDEEGQKRLLAKDAEVMDTSGFVVDIDSATSRDGTSVDYYFVHPKNRSNGTQPVLMTGYGAFGVSMNPGYFDFGVGGASLKLWLERGGSLVLPAARGGGERGAAWHQAALRENRQRSYDDFIAVAEKLIKSGYTEPKRIGFFGLSNGGLLAATMGTQRPDLFGAIVSDVPLTDMIRMKNMGMGAAWITEYGDPEVQTQRAAMLKYSPYHNVRRGVAYPPFLVTVSTEDNRVGPGHARKFAYALKEVEAPVHFYEDEEGGHGVSDALRNPELMTLRMAFFIDNLMNK